MGTKCSLTHKEQISAKWLTSALENIVMQSSHNVERTLLSLYLYQKTI